MNLGSAVEPPAAAEMTIYGKLVNSHGSVRGVGWRVKLKYDPRFKEWASAGVYDLGSP